MKLEVGPCICGRVTRFIIRLEAHTYLHEAYTTIRSILISLAIAQGFSPKRNTPQAFQRSVKTDLFSESTSETFLTVVYFAHSTVVLILFCSVTSRLSRTTSLFANKPIRHSRRYFMLEHCLVIMPVCRLFYDGIKGRDGSSDKTETD